MNRVLCSTGALIGTPNGRNFRLLAQCAEKLSCDGFEFMMYNTWYDRVDEIAEYLNSLPAVFPVYHCEKQIGEHISRNEGEDTEKALERFAVNCRMAEQIGAEKLVLHLWGGPPSDRDIRHNFSVYPQLLHTAQAHGLLLTVENVVCSHADPMHHMHTLLERFPDIAFTFDTKMAAFHSQLELLYLPEEKALVSHIRHLHINDYEGGHKDWAHLRTLHMGEGHIDFDTFFRFLSGWDHQCDFTVEATSFDKSGTICFEKLDRTLQRVKAYIK